MLRRSILKVNNNLLSFISSTTNIKRTFLSQAYYCQEVWNSRMNDNLLQKVNLEELYQELDQRFQRLRHLSAVDVDIFANTVQSNLYVDEMLDLLHKLRLSADTGNTLNSTSHAVIRALLQYGNKKDLLNVLNDRINYGIFLDYYTANILMDTFWKEKDFTSGAQVASQLMLQEEFGHPLSTQLSLLHCWNFLLNPGEWPIPSPPEEPEEEIKIRVKYIVNPFDDDHFDLKDPQKIVGKTLALLTNKKEDSLSRSFNLLGWVLYNKKDKAEKVLSECKSKRISLFKEIINFFPVDMKLDLGELDFQSVDIQKMLTENVEKAVQKISEGDIAQQCKQYLAWVDERNTALETQRQRLFIAKHLQELEELKKSLEEKETKLWFFDNQEIIELQIEQKEEENTQIESVRNVNKDPDENYVPPEVRSTKSN